MTENTEFKNACAAEVELAGKDEELKQVSLDWLLRGYSYKYSYHFEFMGRPIIQYPQDIVAVQELIWEIKPDLIIETGIAHGGSLILSAASLAMLDYVDAVNEGTQLDVSNPSRMVIGIDIDIRQHNREAIEAHPMANRIKMIEGSSTDPEIIRKVSEYSKNYQKVMVFLDSNHTHEHVLAELNAYADLVTPNSYCIVFDTIVDDMPKNMFPDRPWGPENNPKTAVRQFLSENDNFAIDENIDNKLLISVAPQGYLRRTNT